MGKLAPNRRLPNWRSAVAPNRRRANCNSPVADCQVPQTWLPGLRLGLRILVGTSAAAAGWAARLVQTAAPMSGGRLAVREATWARLATVAVEGPLAAEAAVAAEVAGVAALASAAQPEEAA